MIKISSFPQLEIGNLFVTHCSTTINKIFCHDSHFCDVKMLWHKCAIWQLKMNCTQVAQFSLNR